MGALRMFCDVGVYAFKTINNNNNNNIIKGGCFSCPSLARSRPDCYSVPRFRGIVSFVCIYLFIYFM